MNTKISREQLVLMLFANYPKENVFHLTSDDQAFTDEKKHSAEAHARTLEDKSIETVYRTGTDKIKGKVKELVKTLTDAPAGGFKTAYEPVTTEPVKEKQPDAGSDQEPGAEGAVSAGEPETDTRPAKTAEEIAAEEAAAAAEAEKAAKAALKPRYVALLGKNPAPQFTSAKMAEMIAEKEAEIKNAQS